MNSKSHLTHTRGTHPLYTNRVSKKLAAESCSFFVIHKLYFAFGSFINVTARYTRALCLYLQLNVVLITENPLTHPVTSATWHHYQGPLLMAPRRMRLRRRRRPQQNLRLGGPYLQVKSLPLTQRAVYQSRNLPPLKISILFTYIACGS